VSDTLCEVLVIILGMNTTQAYSNPLYDKMLNEKSRYQSMVECRRNAAYREQKLENYT